MKGTQEVATAATMIVAPSVSRNQLLAYVLGTVTTHTAQLCANMAEVLSAVENGKPIVVVLDAQDDSWIERMIGLQHLLDDVEITSIGLANLRRGQGTERRAFQLGATGFFYVDDSMDTVMRGMAALHQGQTWMSKDVLMSCSAYSHSKEAARSDSGLTNRETEVLTLLCSGASNSDIASRLTISLNTVRTHLNNLFRKIQVPNRLQAVRWGNRYLS